jgi:hypothetical protein
MTRTAVLVVGAGAAGLMAAGRAAALGAQVTLLERNAEPGRKLLLSGKGRCNLSYNGDTQALVAGMPGNGRFLFGAFSRFGSQDLRAHLRELGVETKVERGERVFPVSDDAASIRDALWHCARRLGVAFEFGVRAAAVETRLEGSGRRLVTGVRTADGGFFPAEAVVLATGGLSYPGTGSTGDGYRFARALGHQVTEPRPSLVPLVCRETWPRGIAGLALRNVRLWARLPGRRTPLADEFGELLFTHFGISGPIALRASRAISLALEPGGPGVEARLDLKPALTPEVLDRRVLRDFAAQSNREFRNALGKLLPSSLQAPVVDLSGIDPRLRVREVTREQRLGLVGLLKAIPLTVVGTRGFEDAIVTAGGVKVREVEPATMQSRLVGGLFFAGEVLDVDGYTGGFNLQTAFSTGWLAGEAAASATSSGTS